MLIPPEFMGAHIGPNQSPATGRRHDLAFRAVTALFGHFGIEWNLLGLDDAELDALAEAVALHRRFRALLHGGDAVRFDTARLHRARGVRARPIRGARDGAAALVRVVEPARERGERGG